MKKEKIIFILPLIIMTATIINLCLIIIKHTSYSYVSYNEKNFLIKKKIIYNEEKFLIKKNYLQIKILHERIAALYSKNFYSKNTFFLYNNKNNYELTYIKKVNTLNQKKLQRFLSRKSHKQVMNNIKKKSIKNKSPQKSTHIPRVYQKYHFYYPLEKHTFWISARFGMRKNTQKNKYEMHHGVDLAAPKGTPIKAALKGLVEKVDNDAKGFGNYVVIKHSNECQTRYAHMSKIIVKKGEYVDTGCIIGLVGTTGNIRGKGNGAHLHFEIIINKKRCNPLPHLIW